jgi:hypothetical protein
VKRYLLQIAVAVDRVINAALGGSAEETLSSRAYRAHRDGQWPGIWMMPIIDFIFFWQDRHCENAYRYERERYAAAIQES